MNGLNVLDWTAGPFLLLYAVLYIASLVSGRAIAQAMRPDGAPSRVTDPEELALLVRGPDRLADTVVARLLEQGSLRVERKRLFPVPGAAGHNSTERAILALPSPIRWGALRKVTDAAAGAVDHRLVRRGLLIDRGEARYIALVSSAPLALLFALGVAKAVVGAGRDKPIGFLIVFLIIAGVTVLVRLGSVRRLTHAGEVALFDAMESADRLKLAPAGGEAGMAVALFGTGVLAASSLDDFHRMRSSGGDGGSGGGDGGSSGDGSSGDGGSGCGGGGCGGCGS